MEKLLTLFLFFIGIFLSFSINKFKSFNNNIVKKSNFFFMSIFFLTFVSNFYRSITFIKSFKPIPFYIDLGWSENLGPQLIFKKILKSNKSFL